MAVLSYTPRNLAELSQSLGQLTPSGKIIGGGTDLTIRLNMGACEPDALLYLGGVEEIRTVTKREGFVEIGAAATMHHLAKHPLLQGVLGAIAMAAGDVGAAQIRNSATIGGNLSNASPAGDLLPVLTLLDAQVVIAGPEGANRQQHILDFLVGPGKTTLAHNEAVVRLLIPLPESPTSVSAFAKLGYRNAMSISRIGLAMQLDRDPQEIITHISIVVGAISLKPIHLDAAEQALLNRKFDTQAANVIGSSLSERIMEVTPEHFDRDYKAAAALAIAQDVCQRFANE